MTLVELDEVLKWLDDHVVCYNLRTADFAYAPLSEVPKLLADMRKHFEKT